MKRMIQVLLTAVLTTSLALPVTAGESRLIFRRGTEWFTFEPGSGYTSTDLFDNFKDVMPGDIRTETITITNNNPDSDAVRFYLRAEPHDAENPLSYSESYEQLDGKDQNGIPGQREETTASTVDFLSRLTLRVYNGEELIYEGTPAAGPERNLYLGAIGRNRSLKLRLVLEVPVELDNRYADRVGEVDWVFTASVYKDPGDTDVPKTGDTIVPAVAAMLLSSGLLVSAFLEKRKQK